MRYVPRLILVLILFHSPISFGQDNLGFPQVTWVALPSVLTGKGSQSFIQELQNDAKRENLQCLPSYQVLVWQTNSNNSSMLSSISQALESKKDYYILWVQGKKQFFVMLQQEKNRAYIGLWQHSSTQISLAWCQIHSESATNYLKKRSGTKPTGTGIELTDHSFISPTKWTELAWIPPKGDTREEMFKIFRSKLPSGKTCTSKIEFLMWIPSFTKVSVSRLEETLNSDFAKAGLKVESRERDTNGALILTLSTPGRVWLGRIRSGDRFLSLVWCEISHH